MPCSPWGGRWIGHWRTTQNRRLKVFNRELCVYAGGLDILKIDKNLHWFIVFHVSILGVGALFWWMSSPNPPCGDWIGTTWSTVRSSPPHSQAAEEALPHLCIQERKGPTPAQKRLSRTQALLGSVAPLAWVPVSGTKVRSLVGLSAHTAFHWWSAQCAVRILFFGCCQMSC